MPQFKTGNYLTEEFVTTHLNDVFLFTSNNIVKRVKEKTIEVDHRLVMGAGAAKAFLNLFPMSDSIFAERINIIKIYGCFTAKYTNTKLNRPSTIGVFQTKENYKDPSNLSLISKSTAMLKSLATNNPHLIYHLNYPGIGLGNLSKEVVYPIIKDLPDNVIIWELK